MLVVAGLSLKNLKPRVWDSASPNYLPNLAAIMVSYAEFHNTARWRSQAMEQGLRTFLGIPESVKIYLDNGAFALLRRGGDVPHAAYEAFVAAARPDWYPVPRDYIPAPSMDAKTQQDYFDRTMAVNQLYGHDGFIPVVHVGAHLTAYLDALLADQRLRAKPSLALGGIVPNLLRAPRALPYRSIIENLVQVRQYAMGKQLHVFGIGGTATLHLAALLGIDSLDSSGWRNRAARGLIQLPGKGDRIVAELGGWRGRRLDHAETKVLATCPCPACSHLGLAGLQLAGVEGFCHRATHNLWTLLEEAKQISCHLTAGTYREWHVEHVRNSVYEPLIAYALRRREEMGF